MKKIAFRFLAILVIVVTYIGSFILGRCAGGAARKLWNAKGIK